MPKLTGHPEPATGVSRETISLATLALCFLKLGATSFGGGAVGWTYREVVVYRQWMSQERFFKVLAIAQILPGANVVNLAVYVGMSLRGAPGAVVSAAGIVALPFMILLLLGYFYQYIAGNPMVQSVLGGLLCVSIASMLSTCIMAVGEIRKHIYLIVVASVVFVLVGILRWPMFGVVSVAVPASILGAHHLKIGRTDD